ncbi:MAG: hypothetical protein ACO3N7_09905 [Kiritimatiellia bacterium]
MSPASTKPCIRPHKPCPTDHPQTLRLRAPANAASGNDSLWPPNRPSELRKRQPTGFDPNRALFEQNHLPAFEAPQNGDQADCVLALLAELALRLAEHEEDVLKIMGADYRARCLADWKFRKRALDPEEVPDVWRRIHCAVRDLRKHPASIRVS